MKYLVWALLIGLVILHQTSLFHDAQTLVFGFLPAALAYHAGISVAAACVWWLATRYAWPDGADVQEAVERE